MSEENKTMEEKLVKAAEDTKALVISVQDDLKANKEVSETKLKELEEKFSSMGKSVEDMQKAMQGFGTNGYLAEAGKKGKEFSFAKVAKAFTMMRTHGEAAWDKADAGFEKEILQGTHQEKSQTIGTDADGGYLVPVELSSQIIPLAKDRSVLMDLGTMIENISPRVGQFEIPRLDTASTAYWLGELTDITESTLKFGKVTLNPNKVAAYATASKELLRDSVLSLEPLMRSDMGEQLGLAIDQKGFLGDGTSNTPVGILNTPSITDLNTSSAGDACDWKTFKDVMDYVDSQRALQGDLAFVSHPDVINLLKEQTVAQYSGQAARDGEPLVTPMPFMTDAMLEQVLGVKIRKTSQISKTGSAAPLFFGDFSRFVIGMWGNIELDMDESLLFQKYGVAFRAVARVDMAVQRVASFAINSAVLSKTFA